MIYPKDMMFLKNLCWETNGDYQSLEEEKVFNLYERGLMFKRINCRISEDEKTFILFLNNKFNGKIIKESMF